MIFKMKSKLKHSNKDLIKNKHSALMPLKIYIKSKIFAVSAEVTEIVNQGGGKLPMRKKKGEREGYKGNLKVKGRTPPSQQPPLTSYHHQIFKIQIDKIGFKTKKADICWTPRIILLRIMFNINDLLILNFCSCFTSQQARNALGVV